MMSIYCTTLDLGGEHTRKCKRISRARDGVYEQDDSKPCTCGNAPIKYQGSNVLPSNSDPREGNLDLAAIPSHITRNGRDDGPEGGWYRQWLRLGVNDSTIILTKKQVKQLRDALNLWLEAPEGE